MQAQNNNPRAGSSETGHRKPYRDLRMHNERRAKLAELLEARRRQFVEQVARQRRFPQNG
jgi:hypothetical protein